jgi:predicted phage-related endonuclease
MLRKQGLGASDTSVFLGTMQAFNKETDDLIMDKLTLRYTEKDKEISEKSSVRMGVDLEDLILRKAAEALKQDVIKAKEMFRLKQYPYLTMNLDGVTADPRGTGLFIPVEAKVVTMYGDKYYDFNKASLVPNEVTTVDMSGPAITMARARLDYIEHRAEAAGIPAYYYVPVQHEMLGMGAPIGYLAALRIKDWNIYMFPIEASAVIQSWIIGEGYQVWQRIMNLRRAGKQTL